MEIKELIERFDKAVDTFGKLSDQQLKHGDAIEDLMSKVVSLTSKISVWSDREKTEELTGKDAIWGTKENAMDFIKYVKAMFSGDEGHLREVDAKCKAMNEGTDADGGYLVPAQFSATLIRLIDVFGQVRPYATVVPMQSNKMDIPNLITGITPYWVGETVAITESQPVFGLLEMTAKKLAALVPASSELIEDSTIAIATLIATLVAEAFAQEEDRVALVGDTGAGDPFNGILNWPGVVVYTMATGSTLFTDLTADDLLAMQGELTKAARQGAGYWMEPTVEHVIMKLKSTTGEYIYGNPRESRPGTAWGYGIETSEVLPSIADAAADSTIFNSPFALFGNLKHFLIGNRRELTVAQSPHVYFKEDMIAWRFTRRQAHLLTIPAAICVIQTAAA